MSITGDLCLELCSGLCFYLAIFRLPSYQIFSHFPWHKIRRPVTTVSESKLVIRRSGYGQRKKWTLADHVWSWGEWLRCWIAAR